MSVNFRHSAEPHARDMQRSAIDVLKKKGARRSWRSWRSGKSFDRKIDYIKISRGAPYYKGGFAEPGLRIQVNEASTRRVMAALVAAITR